MSETEKRLFPQQGRRLQATESFTRSIAGGVRFFTLIQSFDRPLRYGRSLRLETRPVESELAFVTGEFGVDEPGDEGVYGDVVLAESIAADFISPGIPHFDAE